MKQELEIDLVRLRRVAEEDLPNEDTPFFGVVIAPSITLALIDRLEQAEAIISQLTPTHLKMIRRALDGEQG